ncbi:MAG: hypothetical protein Q8K92_12865 [Leadbetterella sp.]|nr:hypothetical protein [Leadbetterella sp.]
MKHFMYFIIFTAFMLASGCKFILIKMEGVKQPKLENQLSLSKFLLSSKVDTSEILCFKDTLMLNNFYASGIGSPDVCFFNKERKLIDYRSVESDCNANVSPFIDKIGSINALTPVPGKTMDEFIKGLVVVRDARDFKLEDQDYEAYMIIYWAKYLGKVTKSHISEWQKIANKVNKDKKKLRMVLVNVDYQSFWGLRPSDLPKFDYYGAQEKAKKK